MRTRVNLHGGTVPPIPPCEELEAQIHDLIIIPFLLATSHRKPEARELGMGTGRGQVASG